MAAWVVRCSSLCACLTFLYAAHDRKVHMHPLIAVLMIFIGGALAGILGRAGTAVAGSRDGRGQDRRSVVNDRA